MRKILALVLLLALAGCGGSPEAASSLDSTPSVPPTPAPNCAEQAAPFLKEIEPLAREWDDAVTLANSTPRASLSGQIETLQALQRKVEALNAPECAATAQQHLVDSMGATNRAFIAFLGQQSESNVNALFAIAKERQALFTRAVSQLKAGNAIPTAAPIFSDGLGVARSTIQDAYKDYAFTDSSPVGGQPRVMGDGANDEGIELIGSAENVRMATLITSLDGAGADKLTALKQRLSGFLKVTAPDWGEGENWVSLVVDGKPDEQTTATRGRVVNLRRSGPARTLYLLIVQVP